MVQIYLDALNVSELLLDTLPTMDDTDEPDNLGAFDAEAHFYIPTEKLQKLFLLRADSTVTMTHTSCNDGITDLQYVTNADDLLELNVALATVFETNGSLPASSALFPTTHAKYPEIRSVAADYMRYLSGIVFMKPNGSAVSLLNNLNELEEKIWEASNTIWTSTQKPQLMNLESVGEKVGNDGLTNANPICKKIYERILNSDGVRFNNLTVDSSTNTVTNWNMPFVAGDEICYKVTIDPSDNVVSYFSTKFAGAQRASEFEITKENMTRTYLIKLIASNDTPTHTQTSNKLDEVTINTSEFFNNIVSRSFCPDEPKIGINYTVL